MSNEDFLATMYNSDEVAEPVIANNKKFKSIIDKNNVSVRVPNVEYIESMERQIGKLQAAIEQQQNHIDNLYRKLRIL